MHKSQITLSIPRMFLLLQVLFLLNQSVKGEDLLKIIPKQIGDLYEVYLENKNSHPYKISVDVELSNMRADVRFPYVTTLAGHTRLLAFKLWCLDSTQACNYTFSYKWREAEFQSSSCVDDVFCVIAELYGDSLFFYFDNQQFVPITLKFIPDDFQNLATHQSMPFTKAYAGNKKTKMFTAWLEDVWGGWKQGFRYQWQYGIANVMHDDSYAYALPYAKGEQYTMIQGPDGAQSHQGVNAYDWEMPVGTAVHAARAGIVIAVIDSFVVGGQDEHLKKQTNVIEIMHSDGTIGRYSHLAHDGALVKPGGRVHRAQKIGLSGNTGYSSGPHLHFDVIRLTNDLTFDSIPVKFQISGSRISHLREGDRFEAFE
ncbi:M23 family metallopeptidase [candidate division KSB1 bacterium]|nr:M23 family metallopeptidase [candidate division KSB1 bacterium]RQW01456.1 MAG: M23 family metallopeptidase [candidate division KSB1 bacterium]